MRQYVSESTWKQFAAGDYLPQPIAQRLCEILFGMLNPGGRLLIANFLPNISSAGYMEACMDWWLIYRTEAELLQLADTLPGEQVETTDGKGQVSASPTRATTRVPALTMTTSRPR